MGRSVAACSSRPCRAPCRRARLGAGLSDPADHAGGAVPGRRRQRRAGPHRRRADEPTLGQQVVVENRGGAGGTIGTRAVAKAAPDGYTILLSYTGTLAINPSLYPNAGYDPRKDFAPIGLIAYLPSVLVVHPSLPARTDGGADRLRQGQSAARSTTPSCRARSATSPPSCSPGPRASSSPSIPYKGNGNALGDLLGGHVSMMFISMLPIIGNVKAGTLRALAVTTPSARRCCRTCRRSRNPACRAFPP